MPTFLSAPPEIYIETAFSTPFDNSVAAARTCYSPRGIVTPAEVGGHGVTDPERKTRRLRVRNRIGRSVYRAGHHTTIQHGHFQFAIRNVSRQFIWSFLHGHDFYNSEQVSQRYVAVQPDAFAIPPLADRARSIYEDTVRQQVDAYRRLCDLLAPAVREEYFARFPYRARRPQERDEKAIEKKAQEVARYVLPVATFAYLYHTVSCLTLLRYWRLCQTQDAPTEARQVVGRMVELLLEFDPDIEQILEEPLPLEATPEHELFRAFHGPSGAPRAAFRREFDASLVGRTSRLVDRKIRNEEIVADSVRQVLGLPQNELDDVTAIAMVLDPGRNALLGEALNLSTHSKLLRCLHHASYTFRKKLSHAADSQNQRHRTTPASRPILAAHAGDEPDYVVPRLVASRPAIAACFAEVMERTWDGIRRLRAEGVVDEYVQYLLPNAAAVRMTESADLLGLRHKMAMRLCYNAQEEIWQASLEEALQIRQVEPTIGRYLLPPCTLRAMGTARPICPEGERYCGVRVWTMDLTEYRRMI